MIHHEQCPVARTGARVIGDRMRRPVAEPRGPTAVCRGETPALPMAPARARVERRHKTAAAARPWAAMEAYRESPTAATIAGGTSL